MSSKQGVWIACIIRLDEVSSLRMKEFNNQYENERCVLQNEIGRLIFFIIIYFLP